jgi:hypothetical protein
MERGAAACASFERNVRTAAALWIEDHSAPTDTVLVMSGSSVGPFGYYSRRRMIDDKGTVTPSVLRFWGPEHVSPDYDIARALRPAWCVLRAAELAPIERAGVAAGAPWEGSYELAASFGEGRDRYLVYRRRDGAPR